ncbi:MAG: GyrI-like domain-containing protein [Alphaproteobacteria bacterium]
MKWLFGLLITAALAVGAFYGVGMFVVPSAVEVVRATDIDRPASIIYPLLSNLRTFNEISPWFDEDPKADYEFTGPREGEGQAASWVSSVQSVGAGQQKISHVTLNQRVEMDHTIGRVTAHSVFKLAPSKTSGTNVSWTMRLDCGPSLQNVPCRYLNLLEQHTKAREIQAALVKLKTLAEQLPALEIASLTPQFVTVTSQDFAYVDPETTDDDVSIATAVADAQKVVSAFLTKNALTPAGPLLSITQKQENDKILLRVGIPYTGATPTTQIEVKTGKTPGGLALKVLNTGSREAMRPVYARIDAYVAAHRLERTGGSWEIYLDDPATTQPDQMRTAIYYPLKNADEAPSDQ